MIEELRGIWIKGMFNARRCLIEAYHLTGKTIIKYSNKHSIERRKLCNSVAKDMKKGERTIYYTIEFANKFSDLDKLPEGKNITWHKICNNLLTVPKKEISLPKGKYNVIYADPPWPYPERLDLKNLYGATNYHYERMSIKDICNMKVKDLTTDNSALFLWVATGFLEESFEVIKSWGFDYKSQMMWVKNGGHGGIGYYFWGDHELLLVAIKGSFLPKKVFSSVYSSPREKHSKKPDGIYEIIETMYPKQKYLELFARQKRKGWTSFGDQLDTEN